VLSVVHKVSVAAVQPQASGLQAEEIIQELVNLQILVVPKQQLSSELEVATQAGVPAVQ